MLQRIEMLQRQVNSGGGAPIGSPLMLHQIDKQNKVLAVS
jgi:hypothetical protein